MEQDEIYISWCVDDVMWHDKTLTKEEAREVLILLEKEHDSTIGINWDVIDATIDYFKEKKETGK